MCFLNHCLHPVAFVLLLLLQVWAAELKSCSCNDSQKKKKNRQRETIKENFNGSTLNSQSCRMKFFLLALHFSKNNMGVVSVAQWIMKYIQNKEELAKSDINTPKAVVNCIKHFRCHPWVLISQLSWVRMLVLSCSLLCFLLFQALDLSLQYFDSAFHTASCPTAAARNDSKHSTDKH